MKNVTDYTNLEVWSKCRKLANAIYTLTRSFPETERFGLTNQMRRCSVSVPSNIAEGCGRYHDKETLHFLYIARNSSIYFSRSELRESRTKSIYSSRNY